MTSLHRQGAMAKELTFIMLKILPILIAVLKKKCLLFFAKSHNHRISLSGCCITLSCAKLTLVGMRKRVQAGIVIGVYIGQLRQRKVSQLYLIILLT